jgi:ParB family chromosome partitioning protein
MSDAKKKRLSMLDTLAAAPAPLAQSMMSTNRALRSARDAVDTHRVWDLDPAAIDDTRFKDRLDTGDVADLRVSIEANGQTVPILVRRDPESSDRYLLVYGRRRLEAIRGSDKVSRVRALIAAMDDSSAVRAQVAENTARRDLSYIERALFAQELLDSGFGNQSQIAEVLNTTKSAISMALTVAKGIGPDLARAIGPAQSVGRPRWEAMLAALPASDVPRDHLIETARKTRAGSNTAKQGEGEDRSSLAFSEVMSLLTSRPASPPPLNKPQSRRVLTINGKRGANLQRTPTALKIELGGPDKAFLDWVEASAQELIEELHARWRTETSR